MYIWQGLNLRYRLGRYMTQLINYFHSLLLRFPPELAHELGIFGMRVFQRIWFFVLRRPQKISAAAIHFKRLPEIHFSNRLGLAAGFDKNAQVYPALSLLGFGFVEVGTVTPLAQVGNARPRLFRVENQGLVNSLGFNNVGIERFRKHILTFRPKLKKFPLFANLGKGRETSLEEAVEDYAICARALENIVDGFVINISSPNTSNLRELQNPAFFEKLSTRLPSSVPIFIKLAPDLENSSITELCLCVNEIQSYAGVILTNTSIGIARKLGFSKGGASGPLLFNRALECISIAREKLHSPKLLIGVGGVDSVDKARKMRAAGADLIEIYTGFVYQGVNLVKALRDELRH